MQKQRSPLPNPARRRALEAAALGALAGLAWPRFGRGQPPGYPGDTVAIVVPFATGGATDQVARLLVGELNARLGGGRFIVENRAGASATIGTRHVAQSPPDGRTLLYTTATPLSINPAIFQSLPYDPDHGFEPIALTVRQPILVVTGRDSGMRSLADLVAHLRQPDKPTSFGSYGSGTASHIAASLFMRRIGATRAAHVPYGATLPTTDLAEGRLTFMVDSWSVVGAMVLAGRLQVLAVCESEPVAWLPGVATVASLIGQEFDVSTWNGLFAPRGTSADILDLLNREIVATMARETVLRAVLAKGLVPYAPMARGEVRAFVAAERQRWKRLIEAAGIERQ